MIETTRIALPCGRYFIIDEADAPLLAGRRWYSARRDDIWYVNGKAPGKKDILLHTLITGKRGVDHKDRDGLNNQRSNLRPCSQSKNRMNSTAKKGKRFKGVFTARGLFYAMAGLNREYFRSRGHLTEESAAAAYDQMALCLHGEFARLNFPTA